LAQDEELTPAKAFFRKLLAGSWAAARTRGERIRRMAAGDFVYLLAASYDDVADARADFEAVRGLYDEIKASHEFDAAVLSKDENGKVKIEKTYEAGTRHDALKGLGWGMAAGAAAALFPAIGIWGALAAGGTGGAAIGAITGHIQTGMKRGDLKELGDVLDRGDAALIVVYRANVANQIAALIKAEDRYVSQVVNATADRIAEEIRQSEAQLA
jgi:uncharacterized membrane protein